MSTNVQRQWYLQRAYKSTGEGGQFSERREFFEYLRELHVRGPDCDEAGRHCAAVEKRQLSKGWAGPIAENKRPGDRLEVSAFPRNE